MTLQSTADPSKQIPLATFSNRQPLDAGRSVTRSELVRIPRGAGQYRLVIAIDASDAVIETNENNNLLQSDPITVNARPRADLVPFGIEAPAEVTSGTIVDIAFNVRNDGTADTPSGGSHWVDDVWLSTTADPGGRFRKLARLGNQSALAYPGSPSGGPTEYRSQLQSLLPVGLAGQLYIVVMTDAEQQIDEWPSEANNFVAKRIAVDRQEVPPPDLVVQRVSVPTLSFDDSQITVRWQVANFGAGPTEPGSWSDQIWLMRQPGRPNPEAGDRLLASFAHNGVLEVGESYEASGTVGLPANTQGEFYITLFSDGGGQVYEEAFATNINPELPNDIEGSNLRWKPISVVLTPPADLVVSDVDAPDSALGGQQATISWTVTNQGSRATDRDRWADAVYLSDDDRLDGSDQLVFALPHVGVMQVGQSYTQEATFTLPPSARKPLHCRNECGPARRSDRPARLAGRDPRDP